MQDESNRRSWMAVLELVRVIVAAIAGWLGGTGGL